MSDQELDRTEDLEGREPGKLPAVFLLLFWGLIAFGVYYIAAYTPLFSGWSHQSEYERSVGK